MVKQTSIKGFFNQPPRHDPPPETPLLMKNEDVEVIGHITSGDSADFHQLEQSRPEPTDGKDYQKIREENIRRNCEFLAQLGLQDNSKPYEENSKPKKRPRKSQEGSLVLKRIQPKRGVKAENPLNPIVLQEEKTPVDSKLEETDLSFHDSFVLKYVISVVSKNEESVRDVDYPISQDGIPKLHPLETLQSTSLVATYSLHLHPSIPSLFVAAGKGGFVAIYSLPTTASPDSRPPLFEFQAHTKWISSARFYSQSTQDEPNIRLFTAADDGLIKLWDVAQSNIHSNPKLLSSTQLHERGIFAMDETRGNILTGSKDRSVSVSTVHESGNILLSHQFDVHESVVKSVQWKPPMGPPQIFASGSQDSSVVIQDIRQPASSLRIDSVHIGGVHTVSWCPETSSVDNNLFISAGYDSTVKLFDLRTCSSSHSTPLHIYRVPSVHQKRSSITTPSFLNSKYLLIPQEHSSSISIHCTQTGKTICQGMLNEQPLSIACSPFLDVNGLPSYVIAACKRKGVILPFFVTC